MGVFGSRALSLLRYHTKSFYPAEKITWRHPSSWSWEVAETTNHYENLTAMEILLTNPAGKHSRAKGLTNHCKPVLRNQLRSWHEAKG
jgi:hypothetical protein